MSAGGTFHEIEGRRRTSDQPLFPDYGWGLALTAESQ